MAGCDEVNKVREALKVVQPMIDISADRLNGLRTQCATSVDLTRQEIRTLEGKLLKMFARQLVIKSKLKGDASKVFRDVPSVKQWLQVVGLQKDSIEGICEKVDSLETLQEKSDHELAVILKERQAKPDEFRRLCHALFNLKRYTDILKREDNAVEEPSDLALYWDSWDRHHKHRTGGSLSPHVSRSNRQYVSTNEDSNSVSQPLNNHDQNSSDSSSMSSIASSFIQSPPPTPPVNSKTKGGDKQKFPSTPPPHKKHHTSSIVTTAVLVPGSYPLTKSKSHESQLSGRAPENGDAPSLDLQVSGARRGRLPTEPGPTNHCGSDKTSSTFSASPMTSPQNSSPTQKHSVSIISSHSSPIVLSPTSVTNPGDMSSPTNISASPLTMSPGPISPKVISPGTPNPATPVHKTPSPLTPGPFTPRHTPSPNTPNACSTVSPMTVSPMGSSPIVVSPGSLSPIPGSPIPLSPIVVKTSVVLNSITTPITPGGPNVPNSSPITPHSTNSTNVSPVKSPGTPLSDSGDNNCSQISTNISITLVSPHHKQAPTSPDGTSHSMRHTIAHRFVKMYRMIATCNYCDRQILFVTGLKCRECKYKCHRECESKVPASCGLPNDLVRVFMEASSTQSPNPGATPMPSPIHYHPNNNSLRPSLKPGKKKSHPHPSVSVAPFVGPDSSSNTSSCNSSTPSSPALVSVHTPVSNKTHFHFPEVERGRTLLETHPIEELAETRTSNDSDKTVSVCGSGSGGSASTDSERTPVRVDSQESQVSDSEIVNERDGQKWPRQNSQISMREWDIPYDELKIGEPIGKGRFGIVYRGNWHGDVAIKVLNTDYLDDDKALEAFKSEVGTFRKTRHENLVLFMGACMKLPQLAIVTSLSKGMTLYTHIHLRKDKFTMNKTTIIAQQISQGMGYLHARGIVHKDLKSKNIFLENGKVVITDFGLFSVTKLCYANGKGNSLNIPPGWLCYLAPEIIRSLRANLSHHELNFSKASDIYAFGTVWYELLCGEWPFKGQAPEAVIWQVGKGMKQPLANLQASRDVKDILMLCWSFRPNDRREFSYLFSLLEKLPKKRLARSPSHPVHLSRSAESVF